jgi:hypothetical protein
MKKLRFLGLATSLLALSLILIAPLSAQSNRNNGPNRSAPTGPGLFITGLDAFEGSFVIAAGKAGSTSYTAFSNTLDGAEIIGGTATLLVYGDGTRVYTGNDTVTFDVVINADAPVRSETVGMGSVTIRFRDGAGEGAITGLLDLRKKAAAPSAVAGALPARDVVDYITVRATIDGKNTYYLSSLSGEIFDFNKTTYEYTTPADEIYIFPTRTSDAMVSGLSKGPSYSATVNDVKSASPYTYPLRRGLNTFVVKYLENTTVIRTYTIRITSGTGSAAAAPAAPARPRQEARGLTVSGGKLTNGKYIVATGSVTERGKRYLIIGAAAPVRDRTDVTGARVTGGRVVLQLYQMEQVPNAPFEPYTGDHKSVNLDVYQVSQEKVNTVSGVSNRDRILQGTAGTVFASFTNGIASIEIN